MNIREMLDSLLDGNSDKNEKVVKSFVASPEALAVHKEYLELAAKMEKDFQKISFLREKFWTLAKETSGEYGSMRFNETAGIVEVLENGAEKHFRTLSRDEEYD